MSINGHDDEAGPTTPRLHPFVTREEYEELDRKVDGFFEEWREDARIAQKWRRDHAAQLKELVGAFDKMGDAVMQLLALPGDVKANAERIADAQRAIMSEAKQRQEAISRVNANVAAQGVRVADAEQMAKRAYRAATMASDTTGELSAIARTQADALSAQAAAERAEAEAEANRKRNSDRVRADRQANVTKYVWPAVGIVLTGAASIVVLLMQNCGH